MDDIEAECGPWTRHRTLVVVKASVFLTCNRYACFKGLVE